MKSYFKNTMQYIHNFVKWLFFSLFVGAVGGVIGALFHICLEHVTEIRIENSRLIYFLPLAGIAIAGIYKLFSSKGKLDTNRIIKASAGNGEVPFIITPLIFVGTAITHLFGGSAGREGAALQIGGGLGYTIGKVFRLKTTDKGTITSAGMSAVFAALFGTPVAAAVFPLEMIRAGSVNFTALFPCVVASVGANYISSLFGTVPVTFDVSMGQSVGIGILVKLILLTICCSLVGMLFCFTIEKCENVMKKTMKNTFVRAFAGGVIIVLLTILLGTYDYNGAGMDVVNRAMSGSARPWDFIFKILFTAITISAGFKGGEIVPTIFIGSTFGCAVSPLLEIDPCFGAAIGMIALFCAVTNCPVASLLLSVEMFGGEGILFFALACFVSYKMSGHSGLYKSQTFAFSKLTGDVENQ